jgi:sensor c-di-GMP phosphodiesterase-like protein
LPHDTSGAAIIRAVASIAEHIGFTLVAEGVETEEQAAFLRLLGCPVGQGYLYSKPIPNKDFIELLKSAPARKMSA